MDTLKDEKLAQLNRLFVYGIFLDANNRNAFGMSNPEYDTVLDYITQGHRIVEAVKVNRSFGTALTGLVVEVDPKRWGRIDQLESNYDRIKVITTSGVTAWMYAGKEI